MKPKQIIHFSIKELVPPNIYHKYGDRAWQFLDIRMLENLEYIRVALGRPIRVNNYRLGLRFRGLDPSKNNGGLRGYYSAHTLGRGFDFDVKGMSVKQVHN